MPVGGAREHRRPVVSQCGCLDEVASSNEAKQRTQMKMATPTTVVGKSVCNETFTAVILKRTGMETFHGDMGVTPGSDYTHKRDLPLCSGLYSGEAGFKVKPVSYNRNVLVQSTPRVAR